MEERKGRRAPRAPTPEGKKGKMRRVPLPPTPPAAGTLPHLSRKERCTVVARPLKKKPIGGRQEKRMERPPASPPRGDQLHPKKGVVALEAPRPFLSFFRLAFPPPKGLKATRWVTLRVSQSRRKKKPRGSKSSHAKRKGGGPPPLSSHAATLRYAMRRDG